MGKEGADTMRGKSPHLCMRVVSARLLGGGALGRLQWCALPPLPLQGEVELANLGNSVSCVVLSRPHLLRKLRVNLRSRVTQSSLTESG